MPAQEGEGVLTAGGQGCPLSLLLSPVLQAASARRSNGTQPDNWPPSPASLRSDLHPVGLVGGTVRETQDKYPSASARTHVSGHLHRTQGIILTLG